MKMNQVWRCNTDGNIRTILSFDGKNIEMRREKDGSIAKLTLDDWNKMQRFNVFTLITDSNQMERKQVKSSNIKSIGYDEEKKLLQIEFRNTGSLYEYSNIEKSMYEELMSAPSVGSYFIKKIKDLYPFKKL